MHAETLESDEYFHYLDCSDSFAAVYICQKLIKLSFIYEVYQLAIILNIIDEEVGINWCLV